ncbi:MAG TPA: M28 family metallopeptidase [Terriglobales bacterium]|nr:M28 family metallopeptidase [Terriglobales bacterium]
MATAFSPPSPGRAAASRGQNSQAPPPAIIGFRDAPRQAELERRFLAVPDPKLAEQHLRAMASAPHIAGSPKDRKTADYVAQRFREAGLETEIREYRVWMNRPGEISVDVVAPPGVAMHGPNPERVEGDPWQDDARVIPPFNGFSPSGDAEADVVYANYGRPEDLKQLEQMEIDVRGKILLIRYGQNFRGVKSYIAQERGAAGVLLYSDPFDDGYVRGDVYPRGPWRPSSAVQRGSIQFAFEYAGDPTTPGIAAVPSLPDAQRIAPERAPDLPRVPTTPLSSADAEPLLRNLGGPESPRDWQGGLPFTYHVGPGPVRVKMRLKQSYAYTTIWDVIGRLRGSSEPEQWVVAGNHRDAWVYGAVDPGSGTAAMLEAVHGIGELLKSGWRPRRTIVLASWDAEEQGLIGSTEWVEDNERALANAAAYVNMDSGASGPNFRAWASGELKDFLRDVARAVPSPRGGTLYEAWRATPEPARPTSRTLTPSLRGAVSGDPPVGNLGSGSDFTPFLEHAGVPATDARSSGSYGVYHSVFDNLSWFMKFGDPTFAYTQELARFFGLEVLRLANADVLPYDWQDYGKEISGYVDAAAQRAASVAGATPAGFTAASAAAQRLTAAGASIAAAQKNPPADAAALNRALIAAGRALLLPGGLPGRAWYRHAIYAPGEYTGYASAPLPGLATAIENKDAAQIEQQAAALAAALNRAAEMLEKATKPVSGF